MDDEGERGDREGGGNFWPPDPICTAVQRLGLAAHQHRYSGEEDFGYDHVFGIE
jgi:hypothetical protein